jgi:hypothetical protein
MLCPWTQTAPGISLEDWGSPDQESWAALHRVALGRFPRNVTRFIYWLIHLPQSTLLRINDGWPSSSCYITVINYGRWAVNPFHIKVYPVLSASDKKILWQVSWETRTIFTMSHPWNHRKESPPEGSTLTLLPGKWASVSGLEQLVRTSQDLNTQQECSRKYWTPGRCPSPPPAGLWLATEPLVFSTITIPRQLPCVFVNPAHVSNAQRSPAPSSTNPCLFLDYYFPLSKTISSQNVICSHGRGWVTRQLYLVTAMSPAPRLSGMGLSLCGNVLIQWMREWTSAHSAQININTWPLVAYFKHTWLLIY